MSLHDTPVSGLQIVSEHASENGDPILTTREIQSYDNRVLRRLAAEANTDVVQGRGSTMLELQAYFHGQRTLDDFVDTNE